ncbi:hypothetical protein FRC07_006868 [Ceratobasidium sp. 392]|nr:hypothetical protein FRC07_006868 [Ceratobasidium sp. 392]
MTQSDLRAILDDLEDEEDGANKQDDSDGDEDDGGNELAESTPSDVARRRHRKNVRIEADDSDVEIIGGNGDEDVEMDDAEEAVDDLTESRNQPSTLSQTLRSSQSLGGDASQHPTTLDKGKGKAIQDDEIEEYESDRSVGEAKAIKQSASSPIQPAFGPDDKQAGESEEEVPLSQSTKPTEVKKAETEEDEPVDEESEVEATPLVSKKRGRPSLSQAAKDERAAEKARIQAEKAAEKAEKAAEKAAAPPKKSGRPSLTKAAEQEGAKVKETKTKKPRASTTNGSTSIMTVEIPLLKPRNPSSSQAKVDVSQDEDSGAEVTPKKRGRPPLSQAIIAEREAEKERAKAEKKIKKLEARTAKANAKRAKGKGKASAESASEDNGADKTVDSTASNDDAEPQSPGVEHQESHPEWEVLKPPPSSSSRANSPQVDEIEWPDSAPSQQSTKAKTKQACHLYALNEPSLIHVQRPTSIARSMLPKHVPTEEPDTESKATATRPLFMPSSGLVKANSTHPGMLPSSPLVPVATSGMLSFSQPTPSVRRRTMASSTLPRFTDIKKEQDLKRQQRRATEILSSQPLNTETQESQENGDAGVLDIDESSSDGSSSADERANKTVTPSQKKRRSVLGYFSQA